jgi:hypothetical protein
MGGSTGMCFGLVSLTVVGGDLAGTVVVVVDGAVVVVVADGTVVVVADGTVVVVADGTVVVVADGTVVVGADGTVVVGADGTVVVGAGTVVGGAVVVLAVANLAPFVPGMPTATGADLVGTAASIARTVTVTRRGPRGSADAGVVGTASTSEATSDAPKALAAKTCLNLWSGRGRLRHRAHFPSNGCAPSRREEESRRPRRRQPTSDHH